MKENYRAGTTKSYAPGLPNHALARPLARENNLLVDLAEHNLLELVVTRNGTSSSNTTENVGTGTLEERVHTLLGNDRRGSVKHALVAVSYTHLTLPTICSV